jgi:hypothetical protein
MYNIFTHNNTQITRDDANSLIGTQFVDMLLTTNKKCLKGKYEIHNAEMRISKGNKLNIRSSFNADLLK